MYPMHTTNTTRSSSQINTQSATSSRAPMKVSNAVRLGCFHTWHATCLEENQNQCQLCNAPLTMKVKEFAKSFNDSLLHPDSETLPTSNEKSDEKDEIEPSVTISATKDYNFYQSNEWKELVEMELANQC